jgi:hypothetical protein
VHQHVRPGRRAAAPRARGLAGRWVLLALPHADQLRRQRAAAQRDRRSGTGLEHGALDVRFNPTSDNATGLAFATLDAQLRNTDSGKAGVACMVCHSLAETRNTPYHNWARSRSNTGYVPVPGSQSRAQMLGPAERDMFEVPEPAAPALGYSVGAGSYRLSPHAIAFPERLGPLRSPQRAAEPDSYLAGVFKRPAAAEPMNAPKHEGYRQVLATRAEFCSTCHDVTNQLTIKNVLGKWVGGFPIERTYAEWATSRYADRPGNANFDPPTSATARPATCSRTTGIPGPRRRSTRTECRCRRCRAPW